MKNSCLKSFDISLLLQSFINWISTSVGSIRDYLIIIIIIIILLLIIIIIMIILIITIMIILIMHIHSIIKNI